MKKQIGDVVEVYAAENELGEGPLWVQHSQSLCWVDIEKFKVYEYAMNTKRVRDWAIGKKVSLLIETDKKGTLLIGLKGGVALLDMENNALLKGIPLEPENENSRTNDGGCDPNGNLWIGTLDMDFKENGGALYMLEDTSFQKKIWGTTIANGLVWSTDQKQMYFIDSPKNSVQAFQYNPEDNSIEFQREVISIPKNLGSPDGMAIDEEGMLWIAHYGGFSVGRWDPTTGELLEKIALPAPNITACAFGGDDLKTLFITTARQEMTDEALADFPKSGSLFSVKTSVRGVKRNSYSLERNERITERENA